MSKIPERLKKAYFDGYAIPEPSGDWEYELDDYGIRYGLGPWPFWRGSHTPYEPASVRLAPSTEYQSWRTQYVSLTVMPSNETNPSNVLKVGVLTEIYVRRHGLGGWVQAVRASIEPMTLAWEWVVLPPERVASQANAKREKILNFLRAAKADRDAGKKYPITAHDRWVAGQTAESSNKDRKT